MSDRLLTLNAGSSSLKVASFDAADDREPLPAAQWVALADGLGSAAGGTLRIRAAGAVVHEQPLAAGQGSHAGALSAVLAWQAAQATRSAGGAGDRIVAVGHRIVHGGTRFTESVHLDAAVEAELAALTPLAPLHQPHSLAGVAAARAAFPEVPQVACFDTAFHVGQPEVNRRFAIPRALHEAGVRRYGFHGLSYESIVAQLGSLDRRLASGRIVVAHLGNGASMCAIHKSRSVATTMTFSPLDGLTMGTRCGHIDAAAVLYLQQAMGMDVDRVTTLLDEESGLLGLSGVSGDMRVLEASRVPAAAEAIDHFVEQVVQQLGALAGALRGLDAIVFTGGIGENAGALRQRIMAQVAWLGVRPDPAQAGGPRLTTAGSTVAAWVLKADEEAVIARLMARLRTG